MSRSYRRAPGRANVGGFRLDVTVEDKAVRLALRKMRKHAAADAKTTMVGVLGRNMPVIKSGVPAGTPRQGHVRDRLVARARAGTPNVERDRRARLGLGQRAEQGRAVADDLLLAAGGEQEREA